MCASPDGSVKPPYEKRNEDMSYARAAGEMGEALPSVEVFAGSPDLILLARSYLVGPERLAPALSAHRSSDGTQ